MNENGNNGGGMPQITKYKIAELIISFIAVAVGVVYLTSDWLTLDFLLPLYSAMFALVAFCRAADVKASGQRGFLAYFNAFFAGVLAVAVVIATAVYFAWY